MKIILRISYAAAVALVAFSTVVSAQAPLARNAGSRRVQVFSEAFSMSARGPFYVRLDSGVTYRLQADGAEGDVSIAPRSASQPPVRFSMSMLTGSGGAPFVPPATGEYRVDSGYNGSGVLLVRIYREVPENAGECASDPTRPGCSLSLATEERGRRISPAVIVMAGLFPLFLYGVFRNGKSF